MKYRQTGKTNRLRVPTPKFSKRTTPLRHRLANHLSQTVQNQVAFSAVYESEKISRPITHNKIKSPKRFWSNSTNRIVDYSRTYQKKPRDKENKENRLKNSHVEKVTKETPKKKETMNQTNKRQTPKKFVTNRQTPKKRSFTNSWVKSRRVGIFLTPASNRKVKHSDPINFCL